MRRVENKYNPESPIAIAECSKRKIYATCPDETIYKLHQIEAGWAWISLHDSKCWAGGKHDSFQEALKYRVTKSEVYEFDSAEEFCRWAIRRTG